MVVPLKFLNEKEKENFIEKLNSQFGISEIKGQLARYGKERIVLFSGEANEKQIITIDELARVEGVGLYIAKEQPDGIRLSIEGSQLIANQATKNVFEMDEKQAKEWMLGQEIPTQTKDRGFKIMKFKQDFLGTGKASEGRITNFVPKPRRLKFKEEKIKELNKESLEK